jgi:hypothetical protein
MPETNKFSEKKSVKSYWAEAVESCQKQFAIFIFGCRKERIATKKSPALGAGLFINKKRFYSPTTSKSTAAFWPLPKSIVAW